MPLHDWTRVDAGTFHAFHQFLVIEICRALNRGILPPGYYALPDQRVSGPEPDVVALRLRQPSSSGGLAVADAPPRVKQIARVKSESAIYARKADRIVIRHRLGPVVAAIEVISPGNKDNKNGIEAFVAKAVEFLRNGIHLVVIDLFPPGPRDPGGIHQLIWDELSSKPFDPRPADKPLTVASFDAGDELTAYVDPLAVGDRLPDAPLFLAPGWYVKMPLEKTYEASWGELPEPIRDLVESSPEAGEQRQPRAT
jgi:hypothetical protein